MRIRFQTVPSRTSTGSTRWMWTRITENSSRKEEKVKKISSPIAKLRSIRFYFRFILDGYFRICYLEFPLEYSSILMAARHVAILTATCIFDSNRRSERFPLWKSFAWRRAWQIYLELKGQSWKTNARLKFKGEGALENGQLINFFIF